MVKKAETVIDQETLKDQSEDLTDEQMEAIQEEAYSELEDEGLDLGINDRPKSKKKDKKSEKSDEEEDEDEDQDEDETEDDEEQEEDEDDSKSKSKKKRKKSDESDEDESEEEDEESEDDDEDDSDEEDDDDEEDDEDEDDDDSDDDDSDSEEITEEKIKAYAEKHEVDEEQAKTDLEHIAKITSHYKGDKFELAKANLMARRMMAHKDMEVKALQSQLNGGDGFFEPDSGEEYAIIDGVKYTKKQIADAYREDDEEGRTEGWEDDKVFKEAKRDFNMTIKSETEKKMAEIDKKAEAKKVKLLNSIATEDKKFVDQVKKDLEGYPNINIVHPDFDIKLFLNLAKGQAYDEDLKQARKAAAKRGKERVKVLGEKEDALTEKGKKIKGKKSSSKSHGLTSEQQQRALDMYESAEVKDSTKYKWYAEYLKDGGDDH